MLKMARSKQLVLDVHCAEKGCQAVTVSKVFCDDRNLLLDVPDSWQAIPHESRVMPVVTVEFRCEAHHREVA